ncbi:MAG: HPr(Ser) kinase/phosphatase [Spirochaetaceae bacterium]|jgi:HPr kinase/phosphorylase|nr:HPr(Ser) kinase/phosphatase [Spirochaetaceae bacterium]
MTEKNFTVLDLIGLDLKEHNSLDLSCFCGRKGLSNKIIVPEVNRPGLALSGFFDVFANDRIQIFGRGEVAYLKKLAGENNTDSVEKLFSYKIPCCVVTSGLRPELFFIEEAERAACPILTTELNTTELVVRILRILSTIFANQKTVHGVLVEVFGMGVLLLGESGVGKSELALELIRAGHRLVADDAIKIQRVNGNVLIGTGANRIIGHHMEIRGVGVVNITHMFGVGAIRERKHIQLVIELEEWNPKKNYDRLGSKDECIDLLGVSVHKLNIPIKSGRNCRAVIETAVLNERLKLMGYNAGKEFEHNILKWIESEGSSYVYFGQNNIT